MIISVIDHGMGVDLEEMPRIFERFYRGRGSAPGGLGLGLTIARGIVEAHGGRIRADQTAGGGLAIHFTLPTGGATAPRMT